MMTPVKMLNHSTYRIYSFIAEMFVGEEKLTSVARMNCAPRNFNPALELPKGFMDFLKPLHKVFTPRQRALAAERAEALVEAHKGRLPNYRAASEATTGGWRIELPDWAKDQREHITGPADDAELVVKMLNSGAPGVTLDLEDSMANYWPNLIRGVRNIVGALKGELYYDDQNLNRKVSIQENGDRRRTVIFTRARGLHLNQAGVLPYELISASLFDVALISYQLDPAWLKHPLTFYIPKSESAEEALWWRDLFGEIERARGWTRGWIRCIALLESHPLAYQIEEFVYNLRGRIIGLNLERGDYLASAIHFNLPNPEWAMPDRKTIPRDPLFIQNLHNSLLEICHRRGILAAINPNRENAENHPDLRARPRGAGRLTVAGTRAAARAVIRYRANYLRGKGASLLDGYMEDLATDRVHRLMIAQRILHQDAVTIIEEDGRPVRHTTEFVSELFDEELERILREMPFDSLYEDHDSCWLARFLSEQMIRDGEFDPE